MTSTEFLIWWELYPRKVGKLDAEKAYTKARQTATAAEILDGVERYVSYKPAWQEWKHPGPWLRAGRWADEYETAVPVKVDTSCPHTPKCHNTWWCMVVRARERGEV